ncbi:MAG: VCBS repeat-containing protein [Planctomycetota bacterium]
MLPPRLTTILLVLLACGPAAAALTAQKLDAGPGTLRAFRVRDLTGDGIPDLAAFLDDPDGLAVRIWCAGTDGTFGETPDVTVRTAEHGLADVFYVFLAALEKDRPAAVIAVDEKKGVVGFTVVFAEEKWAVRGPEPIVAAPPLPFHAEPGRMAVLDSAKDLDGDGDEELLLVTADGYRIVDRRPSEDGAFVIASRNLATGSNHTITVDEHRLFTLHWEIPRLHVARYDGDEIPDILATRGTGFMLFLQRKDGTFQVEKPRVDALAPGPKRVSTFTPGDVDGDGRVDLLVTRTDPSVNVMGEFRSSHLLYRNPHIFEPRSPGRLSTPVSVVRSGGRSLPPALFDFEGDGDLDLLVSSLDIDLGSLIRKDVSAEYRLYLFDAKKKRFEASPHFDTTRPYPWDRMARGETPRVCFFAGDFDGDGNRDLLDIADDGSLTILAGGRIDRLFTAEYGFEERDGQPLFSAKVGVDDDLLIRDINGDGATDLVARRGAVIYVIRSGP